MYFSNSGSSTSCTDSEVEHKNLSKVAQTENFRKNAKQVVDYICDYTKNGCKLPIYPSVDPGFLRPLFPDMPPEEPEEFDTILKDFDEKVVPGMMHWRHPDFYAYLNCGNSLPNVIGDMLSTACGGIGFSWTAQPAVTELENLMMDWLGRALNLPPQFLFAESKGVGGGCTQGSASDSIFNCIVAARYNKLKELGCYSLSNSTSKDDPVHPAQFMDKLICYTSTESHSCVEKAANIAMVEIRLLKPNENRQITGDILEKAILEDTENGRIPFLFSGVIGSTGVAAVDDHSTIGPVCQKYGVWFHIDAAYGGSAFLLPEMAHLRKGIEMADSIDINPYKLMLGAIDSGCLFLREVAKYKKPWLIDAVYLIDKSEFKFDEDAAAQVNSIDYRHYGIPLSKRFRALKLYFVMRMYGIKGLQEYQRRVLRLTKYFESLVRADDRFTVTSPSSLGVFCFRQKGPIESILNFNHLKSDCSMSYVNRLNMNLLYRINKSHKIHMCPYIFNGLYHLRISVNYEFISEEDIERAWGVIQSFYVTELDEEWRAERKKKSPAEEKRARQLKSQLSFVHVIEGKRDTSKMKLNPAFGQFSVCEDTEKPQTIFRN